MSVNYKDTLLILGTTCSGKSTLSSYLCNGNQFISGSNENSVTSSPLNCHVIDTRDLRDTR